MPIATSTAILIGAGVAGAGTAANIVGQIKAGNAAKRVGEFNALSAEADANVAIEAAAIREMQHRTRLRQLQATAIAMVGVSGTTMEGSPLNVIAESERQGAIDAAIIRREGELQAQALRREAQSQRMAGNAARTASRYGAAGTLLTGGATILGQVGSLGGGGGFKPSYPGQEATSFPG